MFKKARGNFSSDMRKRELLKRVSSSSIKVGLACYLSAFAQQRRSVEVLTAVPKMWKYLLLIGRFSQRIYNKCLLALVPMLFMKEANSSPNRTMATASDNKTYKAPKFQKPLQLTKNLSVIQCPDRSPNRQVVLLLAWMLAKDRHLQKYNSYYTKQGFDVLCARLNPTDLVWPLKGSQIVAKDILRILETQTQYKSILIHGFSVGAYLFGEVLALMEKDMPKYAPLLERFVGQIYDSAVDFEGIPSGFPKATVNNVFLQKIFELYLNFHMKTFYQSATKHYLKSSHMFHNNLVHAPALFLFSKDDPVGTAEGNLRVLRKWEMNGVSITAKCWDSSPHVSHLHHHPDEYLEELSRFLDKLGFLAEPHRRASKI